MSHSFGRRKAALTALRIVRLSSFEHGNQHGKQAVGNTTQRPSVIVPSMAQASIVKFGGWVVLNAAARPNDTSHFEASHCSHVA